MGFYRSGDELVEMRGKGGCSGSFRGVVAACGEERSERDERRERREENGNGAGRAILLPNQYKIFGNLLIPMDIS